jgi:hypothetical protein
VGLRLRWRSRRLARRTSSGSGAWLDERAGSSTPPPSGSDETRPQFIVNVVTFTAVAFPIVVAGVVSLVRNGRRVRSAGRSSANRRVLRARRKSYYRAAGAAVRARRRCDPARSLGDTPPPPTGAPCSSIGLVSLPLALPVRRSTQPSPMGSLKARSDYQSESFSALCAWLSGTRVARTWLSQTTTASRSLELFGHLPPVASADVTYATGAPRRRGGGRSWSYSRRRPLLQRLPRPRALSW